MNESIKIPIYFRSSVFLSSTPCICYSSSGNTELIDIQLIKSKVYLVITSCVIHSMDFDKCVMTLAYYLSLQYQTKYQFHCPKRFPVLCLYILPSLDPSGCLIFTDFTVYRSSFFKSSYSWNHIINSFFRQSSMTLHLKFLHVSVLNKKLIFIEFCGRTTVYSFTY